MYNLNDVVYVYLGELKDTISKLGLNNTRFGKIIRVEEVNKEMYHYTVKTQKNTLLVKSYDNSFNVCNIEELINYIYESDCNEKQRSLLHIQIEEHISSMEQF